ncbi:hypothetical protein CLCR_11420 [Cladophialophora carrionii]|uniref:Histone chaperone domain-containing protein n=1 Tax=Cladophialophora carrionii TaxID=86049 RepID=A0A1C1CV93_9EURO|nr:hypothetical protein CLCR_11420 [Cladophialophora carrionii]
MSANGETVPQGTNEVTDVGKGKGKATEPAEITMEEEDDDEESAEEEEQAEPEEDDEMDEIDLDNIVEGRTRRKQINWAEAAEKSKDAGDDLDDDEDDEDDDFEAPDDEDEEMKG